jgi:hypothetical protein
MAELLIKCSHDIGISPVAENNVEVIFYSTLQELIEARKTRGVQKEKYELSIRRIEYYKRVLESVCGKYKAKCETPTMMLHMAVSKMHMMVIEDDENKKQQIAIEIKGLFTSNTISVENGSNVGELWVKFVEVYLEFTIEPKTENEVKVRIYGKIFAFVVSDKIPTPEPIQLSEDILDNIQIPSISEIEQDSPFKINWNIGFGGGPNNVSVNWNYANNVVARALGAINTANKSPQARMAIKSFLDWYDIMKGSNASILSPQIRDWIIIGRQHVRNIVVVLSKMPPQLTNYNQLTRDFLGCRSALGTWYIGIIDALLMVERNPTNRTYLQSFVIDMKRYCK